MDPWAAAQMEMEAALNVVPPMPFGNLLCPFQGNEDALPRVRLDISLGAQEFLRVMRILHQREVDIAPFLFVIGVDGQEVTVPVTPLPSPANAQGLVGVPVLSSHHILELWDSTNETYRVDMLICDEDLYFIAFRRWRHQVRGNWYRFSGPDTHPVPAFINAIDVGFDSGHGDARPGGHQALRMIFYQLARFQDNPNANAQSDAFQKACHAAMAMFFEPRRLRSLLREIYDRLDADTPMQLLHRDLWLKVSNWTSLSRCVLFHYVAGNITLNLALPGYFTAAHGENFTNIGHVIGRPGVPGELLILRISVEDLGLTPERKAELRAPGAGVDVPDVQFNNDAGLGDPPLIFDIAH